MNRMQLIREVYDSLPKNVKSCGYKRVKAVIDETFDTIMAATVMGDQVEITNFGIFKPALRPPHPAYSAKHGHNVMARPYVRVYFRVSKAWKRALARIIEETTTKEVFYDDSEVRVPTRGEARGDEASI